MPEKVRTVTTNVFNKGILVPAFKYSKNANRMRKRTKVCKTLVILGSGGHTTEMLQLLRSINVNEKYRPRLYVVADTDSMSEIKARQFESEVGGFEKKDYFIHRIPRSREVGQSWISTPFSVLRTLFMSGFFLLDIPDLILCNGPGNCVPLCILAYIPKVLGFKDVRLVYIESFARVKTLSLTGKLLYRFVDHFIVQWRGLKDRYPRAEYYGILV